MDDDIRDWRERETRAILQRPERPADGHMSLLEAVACALLIGVTCVVGYFTFLLGAGLL